MGWNPTYGSLNSVEKGMSDRLIDEGHRSLLNPASFGLPHYEWSFMTPIATLDTVQPFAPSNTNEVQTLSMFGTPTGGTFTMTYAGSTTSALNYNATAAQVEAALVALSNIASGEMACTRGALPANNILCEFKGDLGNTDVALMTSSDSLTGGDSPGTLVQETIKGDNTATVRVVAGVVTKSGGGDWPSDAANYELILDGVNYQVSVRDTAAQITLDDTSINKPANTGFTLVKIAYVMPDDFGGLEGPLTYRPGSSSAGYGPIQLVGEEQLRARRQRFDSTGPPRFASLRPVELVAGTGQRWELVFGNPADAVYRLAYRYRRDPNKLAKTGTVYHQGGAAISQALQDCVLAAAEMFLHRAAQAGGYAGPGGQARSSMMAAISRDMADKTPDFLGYNGDGSDGPRDHLSSDLSYRSHYVTYEGYTIEGLP